MNIRAATPGMSAAAIDERDQRVTVGQFHTGQGAHDGGAVRKEQTETEKSIGVW